MPYAAVSVQPFVQSIICLIARRSFLIVSSCQCCTAPDPFHVMPMCPPCAQGVSQSLQGLGLRVDSCQHVVDHLAAKLVSLAPCVKSESFCIEGNPMCQGEAHASRGAHVRKASVSPKGPSW